QERGMPPWGPALGERQVQAVTAFVLTIRDTNVPGREPEGEPWVPGAAAEGAENEGDAEAAGETAEGGETTEVEDDAREETVDARGEHSVDGEPQQAPTDNEVNRSSPPGASLDEPPERAT